MLLVSLCRIKSSYCWVQNGSGVLIHCKLWLDRAGTVAALMLFELGMDPFEAIKTMRVTRSGAVETSEQENFVLSRPARGEH